MFLNYKFLSHDKYNLSRRLYFDSSHSFDVIFDSLMFRFFVGIEITSNWLIILDEKEDYDTQ